MVAISSLVLVTGMAMGELVSMTSAQALADPVSFGQRGNETESRVLGIPAFITSQGFSSSFPTKIILASECSKMYRVVSAVRVG
jgi:hypothetical protein